MSRMRPLEELVNTAESAWPMVQEWIAEATNRVELVAGDVTRGGEVLTALQVTTRSPMGALAYHAGGIVIDDWLRLLGGGGPRMAGDLARWNRRVDAATLGAVPVLEGALIVGLDAGGGVFAIDDGSGSVAYFSPSTLDWEDLELRYSDFVVAMLRSDLDEFFVGLRWDGWRQDCAALPLDHGVHLYPPLWSAEAKTTPPSKKPVPLVELVSHHFDMAQQLAGSDED